MKNEYVAVVGGVNIDITGKSFAPLVARDSNPGKVSISLGGVGRNIAHNLSLLGTNVKFFTAFGDDAYAQRIISSCDDLGIDISHARKIEGAATSTYLSLSGSDGDMAVAVADMEICDCIDVEYLQSNLQLLNDAQLIVTDTNISTASLNFLATNCTPPIFIDPVSTTKSQKITHSLKYFHTLKPNHIEAELLSGVKITDEKSLADCTSALLATGLKRVFITLGADGVFATDGNEKVHLPRPHANVQNTTGAGDAFVAALAWSYLNGMNLSDTTKVASAAAAIAVESKETINEKLNCSAVLARAKINT